jgi:hypothetical protein
MSTTTLIEKLVVAFRMTVRDDPQLNLLLDDYENSATSVALAANRVVDEFNRIWPPFRQVYTLKTFPSLDLLLYGIAVKLSEGVVSLSVRNDINTSPDVQNAGAKVQLLSYYRQIYEKNLREMKQNIDHRALYGGHGRAAVQYSIDAFFETVTGVSEYGSERR